MLKKGLAFVSVAIVAAIISACSGPTINVTLPQGQIQERQETRHDDIERALGVDLAWSETAVSPRGDYSFAATSIKNEETGETEALIHVYKGSSDINELIDHLSNNGWEESPTWDGEIALIHAPAMTDREYYSAVGHKEETGWHVVSFRNHEHAKKILLVLL